jgi:choline dehydrogenase-like flavoprotein
LRRFAPILSVIPGSTVRHHRNTHEADFTERASFGRSLDWPFEYSDLQPFYDLVQRDVGVSGDAKAEVWRPPGEPYPLPPVLITNHGRTLARGFEAQGLRTAPIPMAILSRQYNGRPACLWDGWCDAGCPIGALANPLVTYLARAMNAGAELTPNASVSRILTNEIGNRATGVEYFTEPGRRMVQRAKAVVLCAFSVENPRILLNSRSKHHPFGLSNSSGLVGRYLMAHASTSISGLFPQPMENYLGATGGQLLCQEAFGKMSDPSGAFGSRQWMIAFAMKPNDLLGIAMSNPAIYGNRLHEFLRQATQFMGSMGAICEDEPLFGNRVELSHQADRYGVPLARVTYRTSDEARKLWQTAAAEGLNVFKAGGATEAWHGPPATQHVMGGTILGRSRGQSVLNESCQSHDVDNLFIGGPGVFPTSSAVNPTFTVHALAIKSAHFMIHNWGSF